MWEGKACEVGEEKKRRTGWEEGRLCSKHRHSVCGLWQMWAHLMWRNMRLGIYGGGKEGKGEEGRRGSSLLNTALLGGKEKEEWRQEEHCWAHAYV